MSRIADFFKGIVSLALIVALLAGIPALLLVIVGFPLPTEMPSLQLMRAHIEDGNIPDVFVVKTLAVVVWIVWIQLAVAVLAEMFAMVRGRASGRAPVLPGIQLFAGKLVASTVLIVSALTPTRAATAAPIMPLDEVSSAVVESVPGEPGSAHRASMAQTGSAGSVPPGVIQLTDGAVEDPGLRAAGQYPTKSGDNWWDMAERLLGDGMRWSELRDLNSGKIMLTGEVISDQTETVSGGWRLDVPADADPGLLETGLVGAELAEMGYESGEGETSGAGLAPLLEAIRPHTLVY
ncbi:MAG: LysM peptidoglycan-binding domain-containing protein, partial [Acidimicrobiales bacterium]